MYRKHVYEGKVLSVSKIAKGKTIRVEIDDSISFLPIVFGENSDKATKKEYQTMLETAKKKISKLQ
jgi:hypothetical protein